VFPAFVAVTVHVPAAVALNLVVSLIEQPATLFVVLTT
jgi:hypothetical protein